MTVRVTVPTADWSLAATATATATAAGPVTPTAPSGVMGSLSRSVLVTVAVVALSVALSVALATGRFGRRK
ncbi:hypothetical protein AB0D14_12425 [Streptomyces sp. NPDC048484]|uniref:hypothetical protein n=1 Tax=Streptomyces sp. NPDC048484 TaxID=3155146 RepID=UPI003416CBB1